LQTNGMIPPTTNPDFLKSLADIFSPDPRNRTTVRLGPNGLRQIPIEEHHAEVAQFTLSPAVPEGIKVQFETTKNLYLYAWFVYRFYPVVKNQALACLELGLRTRFPEPLPRKYWSRSDRPPTLQPLLRFAVDSGAIRNEGFHRWRSHVQMRARERYARERHREMVERNLDQIELDYGEAVPNEEDRAWDYVSILVEVLPKIRNHYAHGSESLDRQALGDIETVCEILNQIFQDNPDCPTGE